MIGKQWTLAILVGLGMSLSAAPLLAQSVPRLDSYEGVAVRILQSNNAGNVHHIIDPEKNEVVGYIHGCPYAHNLTTHVDYLYYYCANEADRTLDVIDTKTLRTIQQIPLTARPNKAAAHKANRKVYVAIAQAPFVDVVDMDTNTLMESIPVPGGVHNVFITPDERYVVAGLNSSGPQGEVRESIQVIDASTHEIAWTFALTGKPAYGRDSHRVRPIAFEAGEDGSTKRMFAQATGMNDIWVIDFQSREIETILSPPPIPAWRQNADGHQTGQMHGLEVLPDLSAVWASSRLDSRIYGWSLPDLEYIGAVEVGPTANWMVPTPDSRYMYVAVSGTDETIAVDLQSLEIVDRIKTGARPARISVAVLPLDRVNTTDGNWFQATDGQVQGRDFNPE